MKPGTRVVSHQFTMRDWDADEVLNESYRDAYLWIVPGDAAGAGRSRSSAANGSRTADITQSFQRIGGYIMIGGQVAAAPVVDSVGQQSRVLLHRCGRRLALDPRHHRRRQVRRVAAQRDARDARQRAANRGG